MSGVCAVPVVGRRKTFWTTQPCETEPDCGFDCATSYGLNLYCPDIPNLESCKEPHIPGQTRSIRTNDYVTSLALNILLTDGRRADKVCGYRPGARGGHWSDSYRSNRYPGTAGSLVRDLTAHGRTVDAIKELSAYVKYDMQKLVTYGVATAVEVEASYLGGGVARLNIIIYGEDGSETNVGVSGKRLENGWAWQT